jgi:hypothetical protein
MKQSFHSSGELGNTPLSYRNHTKEMQQKKMFWEVKTKIPILFLCQHFAEGFD